jgi:hypothetical protein
MVDRNDQPSGLVRPYAVTRGRTRPRLEISLESLVETTVVPNFAVLGPRRGPDAQRIADLRPTLIHEAQALGHDMGADAA